MNKTKILQVAAEAMARFLCITLIVFMILFPVFISTTTSNQDPIIIINPTKAYTVIQNGVKIERLKFIGSKGNTRVFKNKEDKQMLFEGTYTIIEE